MKKLLLLLTFLSAFAACSDDDENVFIANKVSLDELDLLYGDGEKHWKVTAYYENYKTKTLDETLNNCVQDDVYTFYKDDDKLKIAFGALSCVTAEGNEVIEEVAGGNYNYHDDASQLYLSLGRGYMNHSTNLFSSKSIILTCEYISENKMIFVQGTNENLVGIVFEAVE